MPNGVGRTFSFHNGSEAVRNPPSSLTPEGRYRNTSVLDNLEPSGNGVSAPDRQRMLMNVTGSPNGLSTSTFDRSLWLRSERPAAMYKSESRQ